MKNLLILIGVCLVSTCAQAQVVLENDFIRIDISADGTVQGFTEKATGTNYLDLAAAGHIATITRGSVVLPATRALMEAGRLTLEFGEVAAVLRVAPEAASLVLEVESLSDDTIDALVLFDIPLSLAGTLDDPFAATILALDLQTNVGTIPGPNKRLTATAYKRFGIVGATAAIVAAPTAQLRDAMKAVVAHAPELPHHLDTSVPPIGGPWALDAPINRGSYLFDFGSITEETVDEWIALVKQLGLNQIDFHTGSSLRFGDLEPNPKLFPQGRASVKAVLDKLEAAGISAGLHTYAFFLAQDSRYVTPVPDPRLGKDATFTLATALAEEGDAVIVEESTADVSTDTGFFIRNSVTLQIDNELIIFSGVTKEAPFQFTGITRGAHGTKAAAHEAGAKVHKLKECFGLFAPDADSSLLTEVAQVTADTFNECGFDMIYLDALDGEGVLAGTELSWHYGSKFVWEIAKRLEKPALFEMSTFHHHLWYVRARMGAWDHPARSHKRFIDIHAAANASGREMFLPMNLGWWAVKTWHDDEANVYSEPTYPDDIEYLMGKALGHNWGISLMGVNPGNIRKVPLYERLMPIFQQYEDLRHGGYFSEDILAKLREPAAEFTLQKQGDAWRLRPMQYIKHKVETRSPASLGWTVANPYGDQPLQLRIEALMSAGDYEGQEAAVVEDFSGASVLPERRSADRVSLAVSTDSTDVKTGETSALLVAANGGDTRSGTWAEARHDFSPPLNIKDKPALGVWVKGDGQGALLNLQVLSSAGKANGGVGDHYITLDFDDWRYFELVEFESDTVEQYGWPYGGAYVLYREGVDFGAVESFSLWYNNLPPGQEVNCRVSPVKALPLVKATWKNPTVTVNGKSITFPVEMTSGSYLEYHGAADCRLYGPEGELLADVTPQGDVPVLTTGENALKWEVEAEGEVAPRARVVVMAEGEPLN
ncbi:MAG: hypothetical protein IT368_01585 [Candidatus Hydrogenedentes bacterium]|nr:hypothetical protein [Candidatus Hydrogenedentota bacterium]